MNTNYRDSIARTNALLNLYTHLETYVGWWYGDIGVVCILTTIESK